MEKEIYKAYKTDIFFLTNIKENGGILKIILVSYSN